jgi:hypothetical protein
MAVPSRGWKAEKARADALMEAAQPKHPDTQRPGMSGLASKLLLLWSSGEIAASIVQQLSHLAFLDGAKHAEIAALASIGNWGQHAGNCHRDLMTKFLPQVDLCEPTHVPTVARNPKTQESVVVNAGVFMPHKVIHTLSKYE